MDSLYQHTEDQIDGSPMPVLVHTGKYLASPGNACQQQIVLYNDDGDTVFSIDEHFFDGLSKDNPLSITVQVTPSGSMTKEIFFRFHASFHKKSSQKSGTRWIFFCDSQFSCF